MAPSNLPHLEVSSQIDDEGIMKLECMQDSTYGKCFAGMRANIAGVLSPKRASRPGAALCNLVAFVGSSGGHT
jgi:hypothetical protein